MADGWTQLVNAQLLATGKVAKGAVVSLDGTLWGKSDNFNIGADECATVGKAFVCADGIRASGLKLEGEKYLVLVADDERIIGKKQSKGFFCYKTKQAVIISLYGDGVQPEQCSKVTGALADYFKSIGY